MRFDHVNTKWFKYFIFNWLLGIVCVEWALKKYKPLRIQTKRDEDEAKKYPEFRRHDLHKISRGPLYLLAPIVFLRFTIGLSAAVFCFLWTELSLIGHDRSKTIPPFRAKMIKFGCWVAGRTICAMISCINVDHVKVKVNYRKYLGPDWTPSFKNPGTIVSNH